MYMSVHTCTLMYTGVHRCTRMYTHVHSCTLMYTCAYAKLPCYICSVAFLWPCIHSNICHGSDSVATAEKEIALWFTPSELCEWSKTSDQWIYE